MLAGKDVLTELPSFRPSDIPAREALLLLGNRCLSLCESAGPPEASTALWMYYHALKAIIDAGAALLILSGRYRTPHRERLSLLEGVVRAQYPSLLARWPLFTEMMQGALAERRQLRPDVGWGEAVARWQEARGVILQALRCALARALGLSERSPWAQLSGSMHRWWTSCGALAKGRHALRGAARWTAVRFLRRPRRLLAQAAVHAAAPHLLQAIEPGGESPPEYRRDLALAGSYLSKLAGGPLPDGADGDWARPAGRRHRLLEEGGLRMGWRMGMRILAINDLYPPEIRGGAEVVTREAVDGLRERGHDVVVATGARGPVASHVLPCLQYRPSPRWQGAGLARPLAGRGRLPPCFPQPATTRLRSGGFWRT